MLRVNALFSFAFADSASGNPDSVLEAIPEWAPRPRVMLDSGAFSAFQRGITVTIPDLVAWYKDMAHLDPIYAGLDVLYDPATTRKNCQRMRRMGVEVMPTVHLGTDPSEVRKYAKDEWQRIALGGLVNKRVPMKARADWMRSCLRVAHDNGIKVHGFGWTPASREQLDTVRRCDTVDSTSWNRGTKYGTAPLVQGHRMVTVNVRDKATIYSVLSQDRDVSPDAVLTALRWGNGKGKGTSHMLYAVSAYAYLRWGDVIGTPVYLAATGKQMLEALYQVVLRQPEGAVA